MSDIYITLNNEVASITKADKISSGDVDTVYVHFTFSEDWDSFPVKTVCVHTITLNEDKIGTNFVGINSEGVAVVPQKALSQAGKLFIAVVGENTNGEVLTSTWATLRIVFGADFEVEDDEVDVLSRLVPAGGGQGYFLIKASDEDFDYAWGTPEFALDTEMSDTSEHAVQNKVIKAYVDSMVVEQSAQVTIHTSGAGDMSPESATSYTKAQFNTAYNTDFDKIVEAVSENGLVNIGYTNISLSANNELTMVADVASYTSIIYENGVEIKTCVYNMKINYNTDTKHELFNFEMRFVYEDGVMTDSITTTLTKAFEPQAKLTAGDNITISNNVISATSDYDGKFVLPYWINLYDSESYVNLSTDDRAKLYELVDSEPYADRKIEFRVTYFDEEGQALITEAECPVLDITAYTETAYGVDMVNISFKFSFFIDGKEYLIDATNFKIPVVSGSGYDTTTLPTITITELQPKLTAGDNITITNNVISATGGSASYSEGIGIDIDNDTISTSADTPIVVKYNLFDGDSPLVWFSANRDTLYYIIDNNKKFELQVTYNPNAGEDDIITDGKVEVISMETAVEPEVAGVRPEGVSIDMTLLFIVDGTEYTIESANFIAKDSSQSSYDSHTYNITTRELLDTVTAGTIYATKAIYEDTYMSMGRTPNTTVGQYSIAYGQGNTASGGMATALGTGNTSSGQFALSAGTNNTASGVASVAMGLGANIASTPSALAIGASNTSSGNISMALGQGNTSSGATSLAVGTGNTASGSSSVALGSGNTSSGTTTVALGNSNSTTGNYDFVAGSLNILTTSSGNNIVLGTANELTTPARNMVIGYDNDNVNAYDSIIIGEDNEITTRSNGNVILGIGNTSSNSYVISIGQNNTVSAYDGITIGSTNTSSASYAIAAGENNTASGVDSIAMGNGNTASGVVSVSIGSNNTASGVYSTAFGYNNIASGENQTVIGKYNVSDANDTYALIVGAGYSDNSDPQNPTVVRSNIHTLDWDGNAIYSGEVTATEEVTTTEEINGETVTTTTLVSHNLTDKQDKLIAGTNITISNNVISASGGSSSPYIEGNGIDIDSSTNTISVDTTVIQEKLTAGSNISISSNTISADIVEPLVTFTMTPTGLTPAYSVSCDTAFSDITTLVNSNKFKAALNITTSGTMARYIPLTEYKYGGGTTYNFYFSYAEGDTLTTYVISKDYTQQTDVYTYTIETGVLTDTTYSAGTGIQITNGVISLDLAYAENNGF